MPVFDDVNGIIVGGDGPSIYVCLYYDGRPQRDGWWADSYDHACLGAKELKRMMRKEFGEAFDMIFPNDALWELHIYDAK